MRTTLRFSSHPSPARRRAARTRPLARAALLGAFVLASLSCAFTRELASSTYALQASWNPSDPARAKAPGDIETVCVRGTLNYLVPVEGGVVLVDAGYDEAGARLLAALQGRQVLAVLLTHGHIDHRAAAHVFDAPVYVGQGDLGSFDDPRFFRAPVTLAGEVFLGVPPKPKALIGVEDGARLTFGGRTFTAISLPGHTPGSTAWLVDDVLFTGDAVQSPHGDHVYPAPWLVSERVEDAWRSLRRLERVPFTTMFDGHYGRLDDARARVREGLDTYRKQGRFEHPLMRPTGCAE